MKKGHELEAPKSSSDDARKIVLLAERRRRAKRALEVVLSEPGLRNIPLWKVVHAVWMHVNRANANPGVGVDAAELLVERIKTNQWDKLKDREKISVLEDEEAIRKYRASCTDVAQRESILIG